jgi:hypothetical protein
MDESVLGFWRVQSVDRPEIKFKLFYLTADEIVEFTADGFLVSWDDPSEPRRYHCRTFRENDAAAMNVWSDGFYHLKSHCIYRFGEALLELCVSGNNCPRPSEFKRDDQRETSVLVLQRCDPPKKRRTRKKRKLLENGGFIPPEWLKKNDTSSA